MGVDLAYLAHQVGLVAAEAVISDQAVLVFLEKVRQVALVAETLN